MTLRRHDDGIWGWSRYQQDRAFEFNGTAIEAGDGLVLVVDPVPPNDGELAAIRALGRRFEIVLLNAHHERDAARLAQELSAPVWIARPDLERVKLAGAQAFDDGHAFPGGWTAHILPRMKTPGEAVLHHATRGLVVLGDAVICDPATGIRLPPPAMLPDRAAALGGLDALVALEFDGFIAGDGFSLPRGGREALRRFLARSRQA